MKISLVVAAIACLGLISCGGEAEPKKIETSSITNLTVQSKIVAKDVKVDKFNELRAWENVQLVDVRTPEEWAEGRIEGADKMNFYDENFEELLATLSKEEPVLVYCRSGGRSGKTMKKLIEMGYSEIYNLEGGMIAWNKKGMPVIK